MNKKLLLFKNNRIDDRGSTLVNVIIVVMFVSIIATTFLYLAGSNFMMKATDRNTKENFYYAERAAEEIRAGLVLECAKASETAYLKAMTKYNVATPNKRYDTYRNDYFNALKAQWDTPTEFYADWGGVSNYVDAFTNMTDYTANPSRDKLTITLSDPVFHYDQSADPNHAYIRDVKIEYTDLVNDFTTVIMTDFVFTVPEMNWGLDNSFTSYDPSIEDKPNSRISYDISECVNYTNWEKVSN